ncbi:TlpA family protein disulfide reductase [Kribbella catacumbae]|uniref:TlpA family protein disulfide reductase n=1 Tax=Kribbella catacumbae TaxID=460086 RepID=UPI000360DE53|nr:hypothetical protein [Kribbella catacumbae]
MELLSAAVVMIGLLAALNLVLTIGVIRRLRVHTEQLTASLGGIGSPELILPAGSAVGEFAATAESGRVINLEEPTGLRLIGFFSANCGACEERLPQFTEHAATFPGSVLAVAVGAGFATDRLVEALSEVGEVIVEEKGGPMHEALDVSGYPALALVDAAGKVVASGWDLSAIRPKAEAVAGS